MAIKQTKNEVAVKQDNAVAMFSDETPEWAKQGQGRGSENVGTKDMLLPRLEIVQAQSPIKDENEDAKEGFLFNTVTGEVIGDIAYVVPIFYKMEYLVWKDQNKGGGFFGAFDTESEAKARRQEVVTEDNENPDFIEVVDTPVHYCLRMFMDENNAVKTEQIVVSMSKSKSKVSRKWNSIIQIVGGDRFSRAYKLTTFKDKNKDGKTFFNYVVQPAGFPPEVVYREAERLYEVFKTQGVKTNHDFVADVGGREVPEDQGKGYDTDAI